MLEFNKVTISQGEYDGVLTDVSFVLHPGEVLFVLTEAQHVNLPFCDAAQGLALPDSGDVLFGGTNWQAIPPDEQAAQRAGMGRIYGMLFPWLSNLDMDENITLRVRHHARRMDADIYEEARALALELGLDELPAKRPPQYSREILQICQCVRALLDEPKLLLVERVMPLLHVEAREHFVRVLRKRMAAGLAVIWLTANERERDYFGNDAACFRYEHGTLKETRSRV